MVSDMVSDTSFFLNEYRYSCYDLVSWNMLDALNYMDFQVEKAMQGKSRFIQVGSITFENVVAYLEMFVASFDLLVVFSISCCRTHAEQPLMCQSLFHAQLSHHDIPSRRSYCHQYSPFGRFVMCLCV